MEVEITLNVKTLDNITVVKKLITEKNVNIDEKNLQGKENQIENY